MALIAVEEISTEKPRKVKKALKKKLKRMLYVGSRSLKRLFIYKKKLFISKQALLYFLEYKLHRPVISFIVSY